MAIADRVYSVLLLQLMLRNGTKYREEKAKHKYAWRFCLLRIFMEEHLSEYINLTVPQAMPRKERMEGEEDRGKAGEGKGGLEGGSE